MYPLTDINTHLGTHTKAPCELSLDSVYPVAVLDPSLSLPVVPPLSIPWYVLCNPKMLLPCIPYCVPYPRQWHPSVCGVLQEAAPLEPWCWVSCLAHEAEGPLCSLGRDLISLMALFGFPHLTLCPGAPSWVGRWVFDGLVAPAVAPAVARAEHYSGSPTCCCLSVLLACVQTHITWIKSHLWQSRY